MRGTRAGLFSPSCEVLALGSSILFPQGSHLQGAHNSQCTPRTSGVITGRQRQAEAPLALVLAAGETSGDPERRLGLWGTAGTAGVGGGAGRG